MKEFKKMHDLTRRGFEKEYVDFNYFLKNISERYKDIKNLIFLKVQNRIEKAINNINKAVKNYKIDELCFVHGDFHHAKVLLNKEGKINGLLDLDWCRVAHPLEDISYTLMMYFRDYTKDIFEFDQEYFDKLINWYGVKEKDLYLFKEYFILCILFDLQILYHYSEDVKYKKFYFDYQLAFLEDVCERF